MLTSFILALCILPATLLSYIGLKILRTGTRLLFRWLYPDLTAVASNSLRCALDTKRNPGIVTLLLTLQEKIELEQLRQKILTDIVQKIDSNGELQYPKLQKKLTTRWVYYYFWKNDENFDITNHITEADVRWKGKTINETNIQSFVSELCCRPLPRTRPPWQIVMITSQRSDIKSDSTVLLIRLHHLISEDLSLQELVQKTVKTTAQRRPNSSESSFHSPKGSVSSSSVSTATQFPPRTLCRSISETTSVFTTNSATKQAFHQIVDTTQTTFKTMKSKWDLEMIPSEDPSSAWTYFRGVLNATRSVFGEAHKLQETIDSECARSSAWHRAVTVVYLLPKILTGIDWTCTFSPTFFLMALVRLFWSLIQTVQLFFVASFTEVRLFFDNGRPVYVAMKAASQEIRDTIGTLFVGPSLILNEFLQRSHHYPLLRRSGSGRKSVAWSEPISTDVIAKIKELTGVTTNEVLITLCASSLAQYFKSVGLEVPDNILTTIPIYSKNFLEAENSSAGGFVTLSLPTGEADNISRLATTHRRMEEIRASPSKYLVSVALSAQIRKILPNWVVAMIVKFLSRQYLMTLTNINIERDIQLNVCGRNLKAIHFWSPLQANTALSLSLVTYNKNTILMAISDQDILPQPQVITEHFVKELIDLVCTLKIRRQPQMSQASTISSPS